MLAASLVRQDQTTTDPSESAFFAWISFENGFHADWAVGLVYAAVGIIGALVFVYFAFDEALPGMGGLTRLNDLETELGELERKRAGIAETRQRLLAESPVDNERLVGLDALTKSYDSRVQEKLAAITRVRRMRLAAGIPLYIILGGVVASAFATNLLQALLIGFGWTGVVQAVGLRQRTAEVKNASAKEVEEVASAYNEQFAQFRTSSEYRLHQSAREMSNAVLALSTAVAEQQPVSEPGSKSTGTVASETQAPAPSSAVTLAGATHGGSLEPQLDQVVEAVRGLMRGLVGGGTEDKQ